MLSLLGLECDSLEGGTAPHRILIDFVGGEHKSADFLKLNPLGQVPVLVDGDTVIRDSQAILVYLARKYEREDWLPLAAEPMAKVMQWLSFAANEIHCSLFVARLHFRFGMDFDWEAAQRKGKQVLQVMDDHLQGRDWLECDRPTIADIACYPYVGLAPEGKVDLEPYPQVLAWLDRIKQLPGYEGMEGL